MPRVSLSGIVRKYIRDIREQSNSELEWFREQASFEDVIRLSALAIKKNGKRFSHQRRIPLAVLKKAHKALISNSTKLKGSGDFDELFAEIDKAVDSIKGIGELYVYDTALRIAANRGVLPKTVYIHSGTRVGAKALGFTGREKTIRLPKLPREFRLLKPHEIEDVLCIFKSQLAETGVASRDVDIRRSWCA